MSFVNNKLQVILRSYHQYLVQRDVSNRLERLVIIFVQLARRGQLWKCKVYVACAHDHLFDKAEDGGAYYGVTLPFLMSESIVLLSVENDLIYTEG